MLMPRFRDRLEAEFQARRARNARYSLRAFARFLHGDHSTLSQILRGSRPAPARLIRAWAARLDIGAEEAAAYVAAEHVPDAAALRRQAQLQHWTAEALAVVTEPAHWEILRLIRQRSSRQHGDSRWLAGKIGVSVDEVNIAISRLLRLRLLEARAPGAWKETTGLKRLTERDFRKLALERVRQKAAEA